MPNLSGLDVICPMCAESDLETTNKFKPTRTAHAGMIKLKRHRTAAGGCEEWIGPPADPDGSAGYGHLECPACNSPLAPSGYLIVKDKEGNLIKMGKPERKKAKSIKKSDSVAITSEEELPPITVGTNGEIKEWHCPHCPKSFNRKAHLGSHMRVHKNETKDRD